MYFLLFIQFVLLLCHPALSSDEVDSYDKEFYDACAKGDFEKVTKYLSDDPNWAIKPTPDGETCLHLTAISSSFDIAKLMIAYNADVNLRVTHSRGLRMAPLSWHVYSANIEIVRLLLDNGAEINLDFDLDESGKKGTVLDVSNLLTKSKDLKKDSEDRFVMVHKVLVERGGKTYSSLNLEEL